MSANHGTAAPVSHLNESLFKCGKGTAPGPARMSGEARRVPCDPRTATPVKTMVKTVVDFVVGFLPPQIHSKKHNTFERGVFSTTKSTAVFTIVFTTVVVFFTTIFTTAVVFFTTIFAIGFTTPQSSPRSGFLWRRGLFFWVCCSSLGDLSWSLLGPI